MSLQDNSHYVNSPLLPEEIWVSHIAKALEGREDALYCLGKTCRILSKAIISDKDLFMANAARHGSLKLIKWGEEAGFPLDDRISKNAGSGGHVDVLNWFVQVNRDELYL